MQQRGNEEEYAFAADALPKVDADPRGVVAPADERAPAAQLLLHDKKLHARLDGVFADHFKVPRRCSFRVRVNHLLKRLCDVAFLLAGAIIGLPLIAMAAVATFLDTGRPVFYVQSRRVRFGRQARIHKMRTLIVGSDHKLDALVSVKHQGKFLNISKDCSRSPRPLDRAALDRRAPAVA